MGAGTRKVTRRTAAVVAAAMLVGCSGGGDDNGGTGLTPTIEIALSQAALSILQGASGTVTVNLTRGGGFAGAVDITVEGAPTGTTATPSPTSIPANATSSVITITPGATTAAGNYNLTVRARGTGVTDKTQTIALTVTAAPAGSFALAAANVSVQQGASGTSAITITRTNFTGAVTLALEGAPTGVTGTFDPNNTTGNTSTLTLNVGAAVATGTHTLTVRGTATGQDPKTATLTLTVTAPAGSYTLAAANVSVQQGASGTSAITITRTNFTGAVTLELVSPPTGVTGTFNPNNTTGNTSTLTLNVGAAVATGTHTLTVRGTATGQDPKTATLTLTVTQSTGGSGNTTYDFCSTADLPLWFAAQDGNGTWTRVTPTGTQFIFNIASGRGGVAFVDGGVTSPTAATRLALRMSGVLEQALLARNRAIASRTTSARRMRAAALADAFDLTIIYGTQAELNAQGACAPGTSVGKTVNGSVAGVGAQQTGYVSLGPASTSVAGGTGTTFQLTDVPDGNLDLLASRVTTTITGTDISFATDKIIIRRNQNPANNSTLPVLDFNNEGFAPAQATITVGNLGADAAIVFTSFFTANGTSDALLFSGFNQGTGPFPYYGVPTAQQQAGDLHLAMIIAAPPTDPITTTRLTATYFKDPTNRTINLGPNLTAPTVSVAGTTPYVRLRAAGTLNTEYDEFVSISYDQSATDFRTVLIAASKAYLNGTAYDLTIPDFSGVAGWDNNWGLKTGSPVEWTVSGVGFTGIGFSNPTPTEGTSFQSAARLGTITP